MDRRWTRTRTWALLGAVTSLAVACSARAAPAFGQDGPDAARFRQVRDHYASLLEARIAELVPLANDDDLHSAIRSLCAYDCAALDAARGLLLAELQRRAAAVLAREDGRGWDELLLTAAALRQRRLGPGTALGTRLMQGARDAALVTWPASAAQDFAWAAQGWLESFPDDEDGRALVEMLVPLLEEGWQRTRALTALGTAFAQSGRRDEAVQCFREAVAQPGLDNQGHGDYAAKAAFCAWALVDPDTAVQAAREQLGQFEDVWGDDPASLVAPVIAAAAAETAKTDLPRATQMVRDAPETEWTLGGVENSRSLAMLTLASAIAPDHPDEALELTEEVLSKGRFTHPWTRLEAIACLPRTQARPLLAALLEKWPGPEPSVEELRNLGDAELRLIGTVDPAQLRKLVSRWQWLLARSAEGEQQAAAYHASLSALASTQLGEVLHDGRPARLMSWVNLADKAAQP